jgi:mycothiol synthase
MKPLPKIPGNTWRSMQPGDVNALHQFELDCSKLDGATHIIAPVEWEHRLSDSDYANSNSIVASDAMGKITAAGWISYQEEAYEVQAFLDGRVHPNYRGRGIGDSLLSWLEEQAQANLNTIAKGRKLVLRIMFYDRKKDATSLYENHSFWFQYAEDELEYDLKNKLPDYLLPAGMRFQTWSPENAFNFYQAYLKSFSSRTKTLMDENAWVNHFANPKDDEFQPELSVLVERENRPIAFAVCHIDLTLDDKQPHVAWITQMGVHSDWRQQGIGAAILSEILHRLTTAGIRTAKISVNVNNPSARSLYDKVGFTLKKRFTLYRKEIDH